MENDCDSCLQCFLLVLHERDARMQHTFLSPSIIDYSNYLETPKLFEISLPPQNRHSLPNTGRVESEHAYYWWLCQSINPIHSKGSRFHP